jgi:hypothetical protein
MNEPVSVVASFSMLSIDIIDIKKSQGFERSGHWNPMELK